MGSCQSKSTQHLGIHPNNSTNGGGSKDMPPSTTSTMLVKSGTGIANAIAGAHAAAAAAADHGRHDDGDCDDDIYDEGDEFESDYYEIKKADKRSSVLMMDTNTKDRGLLLQPEDEFDGGDNEGTGDDTDVSKVQVRTDNSSRNSVFFSPLGEQTAATELPTPLSMVDGEEGNNYSHTTRYSPPQSAVKSSIGINRYVSGRGRNIYSHNNKVIKDDDNSVVNDEGFEVIRRVQDYDSPDHRGRNDEEEMARLSIVPTSPVPSITKDEFHHSQEQRDDGEDEIMTTTETHDRSVSRSVLLSTAVTPAATTLAASYCAYDYEIDCDDSAELPPLHIDDEAINRIRERLSYLEDDDDDNQSVEDGDEPKLSPDDEAIKRIRERLACLDDDDEEQEDDDNNVGKLLPEGDRQSTGSADSPAIDPRRKNRASSKMVPYSPRPNASKPSKDKAFDGDEEKEEEENVANINSLIDDLNQITPLVAPPRDTDVSLKDTTESHSSVDPKAIASFNKLKMQVELAAKANEKQKRDKKLQDRRADINGYKNLWNEYQIIQEQMKETKLIGTSRNTPSESLGAVSPQSQLQQEQQEKRPGACDGLLLHDPSTWFVDFRAMSTLNHLYDDSDEDESDDYTDDDSDADDEDGRRSGDDFSRHSSYTSQTSMSRLSHSDQLSQQQLFQRIALDRKRRSGAYSIESTKGDVTNSLPMNNRPSLSIEDNNDEDEGRVGGNLSAEKSPSIKYVKSTINGVILPVVSPSGSDDIEVAFDEALEQDKEKTSDEIKDQKRDGPLLMNDSSMECDGPVLNAPTPVASNQAVRPSFSPEYSLPSVKLSIDGNRTGEVRWRNFPVSEQRTTRRKLLFEDEDEVEAATDDDAPNDELEGRKQKRDEEDEHADPLIDNEKARKQIAFLSADQFLRMAL